MPELGKCEVCGTALNTGEDKIVVFRNVKEGLETLYFCGVEHLKKYFIGW